MCPIVVLISICIEVKCTWFESFHGFFENCHQLKEIHLLSAVNRRTRRDPHRWHEIFQNFVTDYRLMKITNCDSRNSSRSLKSERECVEFLRTLLWTQENSSVLHITVLISIHWSQPWVMRTTFQLQFMKHYLFLLQSSKNRTCPFNSMNWTKSTIVYKHKLQSLVQNCAYIIPTQWLNLMFKSYLHLKNTNS